MRAGGFFYFWWMSLGPAVPLFLLALGVTLLDVVYAAYLGKENADGTGGSEGK